METVVQGEYTILATYMIVSRMMRELTPEQIIDDNFYEGQLGPAESHLIEQLKDADI